MMSSNFINTLYVANNKGAGQIVQLDRLICAFVVRIDKNKVFF